MLTCAKDLKSMVFQVFQLDFLSLQGPNCLLQEWTYQEVLLLRTLPPMCIVPLIAVPSLVTSLLGLCLHGGLARHPSFDRVIRDFWFSLLFFLYLRFHAALNCTQLLGQFSLLPFTFDFEILLSLSDSLLFDVPLV